VSAHLEKIRENVNDREVPHWKTEVRTWPDQIEEALRHVGKNTAKERQERIEDWRDRLAER
jgi:hypothetical protein